MKIGMGELLVILIIALVILGPDKFPEYARKLGEALRQFKKYSSEATKDIRESIVEPMQEAQRPLREAMEPVKDLKSAVDSEVKDLERSIKNVGKPAQKQPEVRKSAETVLEGEAENASGKPDNPEECESGEHI